MKRSALATLAAGVVSVTCGTAAAQSPEYMMEDCRNASQAFYQDYQAQAETKYEGQRTDGTHAVNGTIYLETRSANFQCSYGRSGQSMVDFYADGQSWPDFVRGGGSPHQANSGGGQAPARSVSTERVRFPAGSTNFEFPAQLPPGMTVRYELRAGKNQFLDVRISPATAPLTYRIVNPNGTALLDELPISTPYRGQLWQSGTHVVEVINNTESTVPFDIYFALD